VSRSRSVTVTGGRAATTGVIRGRYALSVGRPSDEPPAGFAWTPLSAVARLESGHTPSRTNPAYWNGDVPWIGIRDATENHGRTLDATKQYITEEGLANSSARLLPAGTVCLSRTASVGYTVAMGRPMATSQDFVNWVCGPDIESGYLKYLLLAEHDSMLRFASGTTHQTIYFPEAKAFHVLVPDLPMQRAVVAVLGLLDDRIECNRRLAAAAEQLVITLYRSQPANYVPLSKLAEAERGLVDLTTVRDPIVDHFSLPAFDAACRPDRVAPNEIRSGKFEVRSGSVLVSRLNPRIPRVWLPDIDPIVRAVCSSEFLVLRPRSGVSAADVWAVSALPETQQEMVLRATGTSGSHQRVRPDDAMAVPVIDPREMPAADRDLSSVLLERTSAARRQAAALAAIRDALLPKLLTGQVRPEPVTEAVA
jgi:type I restriction enzyme, S subunit